MNNSQIRKAAKGARVNLWQIAYRMGISDSSFSRKLRRELPDTEMNRLLAIIDEIAAERGANYECASHEKH